MKIVKYISLVILASLFACNRPTEQGTTSISQKEQSTESIAQKEQPNKWTDQIECFGNLNDYQQNEDFELIKLNIYLRKTDSTFHLLTCDFDGQAYHRQLDKTVDVVSLDDHGEFWTDRNYIYYEYLTSDGIQLHRLDTADRATFKTFGKTIYARDKDHIYDSRHGIVNMADLDSFRPIVIDKESGASVYAKDKYNYFFWDEIVEDTVELKKYLNIE